MPTLPRPPRLFRIAAALAATFILAGPALAAQGDVLEQTLEASLKEKKGVMLYVQGQAISGRVTRLDNELVELTSREFVRIVVRRDRIDAVAGN